MPNQARFTQNVNNPLLKTVNSTSGLMEFPTSSDRHLDVNLASADSGHGLATEAKQDDQITKLTEIDTAIDSIDGKITVGSDDSITGSLQQNLVYGRFAGDGSLKAIKATTEGKLITAPAGGTIITTDGTTDEQRVMMLARSGANLRTVLCDGNGALIVDPSEGGIITADGETEEQRVMIQGAHNGNLRTVKVGDGGAVNTEVDHSWDSTNQIFNAEACADGATITSSTFDLGQGVSHEIGAVEFFLDNSAGVEIEIQGLTSYNGTDFYSSGSMYSVANSKNSIYFSQEDVGIGMGHRYMKLSVTNNDGLGTSTNISCQVGYYN